MSALPSIPENPAAEETPATSPREMTRLAALNPPSVLTEAFRTAPPSPNFAVSFCQCPVPIIGSTPSSPGGLLLRDGVMGLSFARSIRYADVSPAWTGSQESLMVTWTAAASVPLDRSDALPFMTNWKNRGSDELTAFDVVVDAQPGSPAIGGFVALAPGGDQASLGVFAWDTDGFYFTQNVEVSPFARTFVAKLGFPAPGGAFVGVFDPAACSLTLYMNAGNGRLSPQVTYNGSIGPWQFHGGDRFYPADVDGDGLEELVVVNLDTQWIGVLKQNNGALDCVWLVPQVVPPLPLPVTPVQGLFGFTWSLREGDQFHVARFGDRDMLVAFNSDGPWMGVISWQTQGLVSMWGVQSRVGTDALFWQLQGEDRIHIADVEGTGGDQVVLFNPMGPYTGVLEWTNGQLSPRWLSPSPFPGKDGAPAWNQSQGDVHFVVAPSSGGDRLLVHDNGDFVGVIGWDGSGLSSLGVYPSVIPGWSVDFIVNGPATPLPTFSGGQQQAYVYISNTLGQQIDSDISDIRSTYTNLNIEAGQFDSWAGSLRKMTFPSSGISFSQEDWDVVVGALDGELPCIGKIRKFFGNIDDLLSQIDRQRQTDLLHVASLVVPDPSSQSEVTYWAGQILEALAWAAAAAVPEGGGIPMSFAASILGSALADGGSDDLQQVPYAEFAGMVNTGYFSALALNGRNMETVLADAVKMRMIKELVVGPWAWSPEQTPNAAQATQNPNRIAFYQILLPTYYSIKTWEETPYPYPTILVQEGPHVIRQQLDAPSYAYWAQPLEDGNYNVYLLQSGSDYPSSDMMDDLFNQLGVSHEDFFVGNGGWAQIPRG